MRDLADDDDDDGTVWGSDEDDDDDGEHDDGVRSPRGSVEALDEDAQIRHELLHDLKKSRLFHAAEEKKRAQAKVGVSVFRWQLFYGCTGEVWVFGCEGCE